MNERGDCRCAEEYAARWPGMPTSELALVHDPVCPVRLERLAAERRRAARGVRGRPRALTRG